MRKKAKSVQLVIRELMDATDGWRWSRRAQAPDVIYRVIRRESARKIFHSKYMLYFLHPQCRKECMLSYKRVS